MTLPEAPPSPDEAVAAVIAPAIARLFGPDACIGAISRFHGGAARETYRLHLTTAGGPLGLVLRRDPPASLIATERAVEYHALARAHVGGLPVPEPLHLCETAEDFGAPGFLMREIAGGHAPGPFDADPYGAARERFGHAMFHQLGRLHRMVPDADDRRLLPDQPAQARLAHWAAEIARTACGAEPVADAAIRWLQRHLPPPSGPDAIVHGDYRSGNLLVDDAGGLLAILDWEMVHLGDPMEDLAWAMDPLWAHASPLAAGCLPEPQAIATWEAASGRLFQPESWRWWRLFAALQGLAIWISSGHEVARMQSLDPVLSFAATWPYRNHMAAAAAMLADYGA